MNNIAFSHADFARLIKKFAAEMPRLLLRHQSTADLALEIDRLNLEEIFHQRFTVAIVGQMRVGKSTLINALIGDDLAHVGATETTATVNWFRYSENEVNDYFRVHWKDGSSEDIPLSEKKKWSGKEENARNTKSLDFFTHTDFLKTANVVDTPGTRSVDTGHRKTILGFLKEELERESLAHGGRADALIYALNPLARETDQDILTLFGKKTRLPGVSAINSIAVVQKWEHLLPDPFDEVEKKCEYLKEHPSIKGQVADVIPTSGLLARRSSTVSPEVWQLLLKLVRESKPDALSRILKHEKLFKCAKKTTAGVSLEAAERKRIASKIGWGVIPICRFIIGKNPDATVDTLPQLVRKASGIDALDAKIREQFFKHREVIKANAMIAKAMNPCERGAAKLAEAKKQAEKLLTKGKRCQDELDNGISKRLVSYLEETTSSLQKNLDKLEKLALDLDKLKENTKDNCNSFDDEQKALSKLEHENCDLTEDDKAELRTLFGVYGIEPDQRLGLVQEQPANLIAIMQKEPLKRTGAEKKKLAKHLAKQKAAADTLIDKWVERASDSIGDRQVAKEAVRRVEQLLNYLQSTEVTRDEPDCH